MIKGAWPTRLELGAIWLVLLCRASTKPYNVRHVILGLDEGDQDIHGLDESDRDISQQNDGDLDIQGLNGGDRDIQEANDIVRGMKGQNEGDLDIPSDVGQILDRVRDRNADWVVRRTRTRRSKQFLLDLYGFGIAACPSSKDSHNGNDHYGFAACLFSLIYLLISDSR